MNFAYPINLRFECNRCGLCCGNTEQKTRHILLLAAEAKKIAVQTAQRVTDFSYGIRDKAPYVYEMKKSSKGRCIFIDSNSQCSIYHLRPIICRFYPFELKFDQDSDRYNFDFTFECPGINHGKVLLECDFGRLFALAQERLP